MGIIQDVVKKSAEKLPIRSTLDVQKSSEVEPTPALEPLEFQADVAAAEEKLLRIFEVGTKNTSGGDRKSTSKSSSHYSSQEISDG